MRIHTNHSLSTYSSVPAHSLSTVWGAGNFVGAGLKPVLVGSCIIISWSVVVVVIILMVTLPFTSRSRLPQLPELEWSFQRKVASSSSSYSAARFFQAIVVVVVVVDDDVTCSTRICHI